MKKMLHSLLSLALCLVLVTALTIPASAESLDNFTDAEAVGYDEAVEVLMGIGIIDGVEAAGLSSGGTFTRGMLATLIARFRLGREAADALAAPETAPFSDVGVDDPYAAVIAYCKEQGIIDGHGDGSFDPNGAATNLAMAKMLLAALGYDGGLEGFTGAGWEANVGSLAKSTGLVRDDDSTSFGQPIAGEIQEELEIIPASFSATAATLLAAAEMPRVEYTDVEAPTTPFASTRVYTIGVTGGKSDTSGETDGETDTPTPLPPLRSTDRLTVTRTIPSEAFSAPSSGGAQYAVADGAATMPEGKAVGYRENDNDKTLYLSDEDAQALLALVQNMTPEEFARFSAMFAGSATYPDGTTTGDNPTDWLNSFTADQGLVDMFLGFVGDSLTAPVQVGANIYDPVAGTVTNAYTDEQTTVADAVTYPQEAAKLPEADAATLQGTPIGYRDGVAQYGSITVETLGVPLVSGFDGLTVAADGTRDPFGRPQTVYQSGEATETLTHTPDMTYTDAVTYAQLSRDLPSLSDFADIDYYVDGVLTEGVITPELPDSSADIPTTGEGALTEVYIEEVYAGGTATKVTVVTITAPEEYTLRHIAVATLSANDDGSAKLSGREITDADLEIKKNGDVSLINTYTDYPWVSGLEIPAAAAWTRIGATPAQVVEVTATDADGNPLLDENGEPMTEQTLTALGTVPTDAARSAGGTSFFEDVGGNTAGWIYVFTLCYDADGSLARVYQFDEPIAYPLASSSGGTTSGGMDCGCSPESGESCACHEEQEDILCGCPNCWCVTELGEEIE